MATYDIESVIDWLVDGARSAREPEDVLLHICESFATAGFPLWRVAVFVRTLHPDVMGRRFIWREGEGVAVAAASYDRLDTPEYRESTFRYVCETGKVLRRRLADSDCPLDYETLPELRSEGATDYVAMPIVFTDGVIHVATWTTRAPGGFTEAQLDAMASIMKPLARVAEIRALRRTGVNLLDTYVGHQAGERIQAGRIRRGHTEAIHAAIWLSDMRGFTGLSNRLPPETLIDLLNRYFDCQVPPILERGDEVLKFMGDGLLAIFPVDRDGGDTGVSCARALDAARDARARVAALGGEAQGMLGAQLRFGLALHLGEVLYGNIGGGRRLDFTCIGPAVNLAARIEKLAGQLGRVVLASASFAENVAAGLVPLGAFDLPGFASAQSVFGLADEGAAV